jgi:hypothetical protein
MTLRETRIREILLKRISPYKIEKGEVLICCPSTVGEKLQKHFTSKGIKCRQPQPFISTGDSEVAFDATTSLSTAKKEIKIFVNTIWIYKF